MSTRIAPHLNDVVAGWRDNWAALTTRPGTTLRPDQALLLPRIRYDATEAPSTVVQRLRSSQ